MYHDNRDNDPMFARYGAGPQHVVKGHVPYTGPPILSTLAVTSLITALLSPLLLCVCGLSVVSSFVAIVTGHMGLARIHRSQGHLTGYSAALIGLILGYPMFGVSLVVLAFLLLPLAHQGRLEQTVVEEEARPALTVDAPQTLQKAEVDLAETGSATGNTPVAVELAADYAKLIKGMRDVLFADADQDLPPTDGEFNTHCQLHDGQCAFLVQVPNYRKLDEDTQERLATVAWTMALGKAREHLQPGDELAVGIRTATDYGAVLIGKLTQEEEHDAFEQGRRDDLLPFFSAAIPATVEPPLTRPRATKIRLTDVPISREVVQEFPEMGWAIKSLAFSPDGRWLAAGKMDRKLLILDIATGQQRSNLDNLSELSSVDHVAFSPDGKLVVAAGSSGAVYRWAVDQGGVLTNAQRLPGHDQAVQCLTVNSNYLVSSGRGGDTIWQTWDAETASSHKLKALKRGTLAIHLRGNSAMLTDGSTLAQLDLAKARSTSTRNLARNSAQGAAFSRDGDKLAIATGYHVQVWDTATGKSLRDFEGDHEMQWSVAFLPNDSNRLISGGRGFATLWNLQSGKAECRFDLGGVLYIQTMAVSPDGTLLATIPASAGQTLTVLRIPQ